MTRPAHHRTRPTFLRTSLAAITALLMTVGLSVGGALPAQAATSGYLHTKGSEVLTSANAVYTIKATSWFGMETSNCAPHGLWTISLEEGLKQIAGWGFNTIRLPFSNECLAQSTTSSINTQQNPTLASLTPLKLMDTVIARAKANGLNVILDRHRPDSGSQSELWYTGAYSEKKWIDDWTMLAQRYKSDPTVIGVDLHNEPHGNACWGCGTPAVDWQAAATRAGNAVLAVNPQLLIIVEGVEREADGSSTWWGGGLQGVKTKPVTLNVANRVVYSPHDYPSTVYAQKWFTAANYPANLEGMWEKSWGYIQTEKIAPVLLGEFGTKLETTSDKQWLSTLVNYLKKKSISFAYWSFNPNSGDTGGLVTDDWRTPQRAKLDALAPILGVSTGSTPTPTATPKATPTPTATPKPSATPTPTATPKPSATPTPTATPKPTATPTPVPPSTSNTAGVTAKWTLQSSWGDGYVADFQVSPTKTASSWSVSWSSPSARSIVNSWGMSCTLAESVITCVGADWAAGIPAGQSVRAGLQVSASTAPADPKISVTSTAR